MINSVHIFHSPIENESRLMKETSSIIKLGLVDKVYIFGKGMPHLERVTTIDSNRIVYRSPILKLPDSLSRFMFFKRIAALVNIILFFSYVYFKIKKFKPNYISCHNLLLLPLCHFCKKKTKAIFIYEPHELETERTGLVGRLKQLSSRLEKKYIHSADKILTVCEPISEWYRNHYNLTNVFTARNVPVNPFLGKQIVRSKLLQTEFNIHEDELVFIYQGVLDEARGVNELIELFKRLPKDRHLVLMGYGNSVDWILQNCCDNIHYKAAVHPNQIIDYTSSADIGIFFISHEVSLSYQFCLPNKFFEYLIAGLPVIVSKNLTYLSGILEEQEIGWSFNMDGKDLKKKVENITRSEISHFNKKILEYSSKNAWQFEENELKALYN